MFAELVEISPMSAGKPKFRAFYVVAFKTRNYIGGRLKSDFQSDLNGPTAVRWLFRAGGLLGAYIVISIGIVPKPCQLLPRCLRIR